LLTSRIERSLLLVEHYAARRRVRNKREKSKLVGVRSDKADALIHPNNRKSGNSGRAFRCDNRGIKCLERYVERRDPVCPLQRYVQLLISGAENRKWKAVGSWKRILLEDAKRAHSPNLIPGVLRKPHSSVGAGRDSCRKAASRRNCILG